jgi:hypothetical protein
MDIAASLGLLCVVVGLVVMMGGDLHMFVSEHAFIVIFGGSFAATLIRFPLSSIFHGLPLGAKLAFTMRRSTQRELVDELAGSPKSPANPVRWASNKSRPKIRSWQKASASSPMATTPTLSATISSATATTSSPISMRAKRSTARSATARRPSV